MELISYLVIISLTNAFFIYDEINDLVNGATNTTGNNALEVHIFMS